MAAPIDLSAIRPDTLYPPAEAARIRNKSEKTLSNERSLRIGPAVTYVGKHPYYQGADLIADIQRGRVDFQRPRTTSAPRRRRSAA